MVGEAMLAIGTAIEPCCWNNPDILVLQSLSAEMRYLVPQAALHILLAKTLYCPLNLAQISRLYVLS